MIQTTGRDGCRMIGTVIRPAIDRRYYHKDNYSYYARQHERRHGGRNRRGRDNGSQYEGRRYDRDYRRDFRQS